MKYNCFIFEVSSESLRLLATILFHINKSVILHITQTYFNNVFVVHAVWITMWCFWFKYIHSCYHIVKRKKMCAQCFQARPIIVWSVLRDYIELQMKHFKWMYIYVVLSMYATCYLHYNRCCVMRTLYEMHWTRLSTAVSFSSRRLVKRNFVVLQLSVLEN